MMGDLLIRSDSFKTLEEFAPRLFALLDSPSFCVRYSDNYFGGRYFIAQSLGLTIKLALGDDSELPDYDFWLTFDPPGDLVGSADRTSLDGMADLLARKLAFEGFEIARPLGGYRIGAPKMFYRKRPQTNASAADQIEVWKA
jgi:hypothetical protein